MRETFIAMWVMVGLVGTIYISRQHPQKESSSRITSKKAGTKTSHLKKFRQKGSQTLTQGERDESTSDGSRQQVESDRESIGSEEGASDSFEQAQKLPSIYQDEETELSGSTVAEEELESESDGSKVGSQTSPAKNPVVYGIPVASWLKLQKNRLASKVDLTEPTGMRLFFNCMELKKQGTENLSQKQCKEIAVSREKSRGAALIQ